MNTTDIDLQRYADFRPTGFDTRGLALDDRQDWFVAPATVNRDSDVLAESNWHVQSAEFDRLDPDGEDHETHRFGHWACGWFEIVVVRPDSPCHRAAQESAAALADYPVLDDSDFSDRETEAANQVWANMRVKERIDYVRRHRSEFEFRNFCDLVGCVRGKYFAGDASELLA